ncbi:ABC-2 type transport system ATP-binding protein [Acetitomaculum ruminis DSM 5522]|uniref:ABC-2 type transport system ATP-binding protein n=1 Tax=Acetitomaculum ruminis DSM 5522 TaxID=1120918 RepID=A0A1I0VKP7_9FIRM|nr:ABC transporter ATP-binding protein [Acetitomaculum ruminis]SFA76607.1 ABC-2 type transport system ATP-binding protein [Acetitomaculum ruminis DSM 5522]
MNNSDPNIIFNIYILIALAITGGAMVIYAFLNFIQTVKEKKGLREVKIIKTKPIPVQVAKELYGENFEKSETYMNQMLAKAESSEYSRHFPTVSEYLENLTDDKHGEKVISVMDVTMEFHINTYQPSSIKEYFIQLLKNEVIYRKLYALYHVSFNVYKGEVVGIIGTNGSGKSTLVKIVSKALTPTSGTVIVDQDKVALLTLGTGFDYELTAKENVYLNGSIIGYSKEFIDNHYDEIVEFAELEDFMDEKIKNFSSGMISRLAFSIATASDAPEILILDEVLAVGDEFFRKKSLKRIKEMLNSGSTVLLVSHSMRNILDNCTRCIWLDKGKIKMSGEPMEVCKAYGKLQQ